MMAATLANGGKNPVTKKQVIDAEHVPEILAVMATAGLYDDSGKWLYHVGPARRRAASAAASSRCRPASSASPRSRRRSTRPATACARRRRSQTSRTRSAAIRTRSTAALTRDGQRDWTPCESRRAAVASRRASRASVALRRARRRGAAQPRREPTSSNDSHFHLTNYVQEGTDVARVPEDHGRQGRPRRRCSAFRCSRRGRYENSGDFAPTYYLADRRAALLLLVHRRLHRRRSTCSLPESEQARFDPMITGFNPADMYAVDHIRRVLADVPGRVHRHRRVHDPQGVRLVEGRRRRREPDRSGARPHPRLRGRGRARRADPQRHRHAVREGRAPSPST